MMSFVMIAMAVAASALAAPPAAPTFQELMDPALFPDPQYGMRVESVTSGSNSCLVRTTGADMLILPAEGRVVFSQRIGHPRPLVTLHLGGPMEGLKVTHSGPGFARLTCERPRLAIRVNGDSLFMLHAQELLHTRIERRMDTAWSASFGANHLLADEWGAYGLYCSEAKLNDHFDADAGTVARHELPADSVLWVAVCPPKPYDWDRSLKDDVVWHWSNRTGYPPDDELRRWKEQGNIALLQSEVMLWKEWNLAFVPRLGDEEFARVRGTVHDLGMRLIVYTSPYFFLKAMPMEKLATNNFALGTATGENMDVFLAEITRVMRDYKPDGLYFDGQYMDSPAALYALARRSREIVGEDGVLEWHSTAALGQGWCYLPPADAYVDFMLRGEGQATSYPDRDYLRFFVSGYNINNCIGVLCNNDAVGLTPQRVNNILSVNARTHTLAAWLDRPDLMTLLKQEYTPRLNAELRTTVDRECARRQAAIPRKRAEAKAESEALSRSPEWGKPIYTIEFDTMPDVPREISPQNPAPFSIVDGRLHIRALAHTYAYLRIPLKVEAGGFEVKLRQGTDGGMSWGPAAMLRWSEGLSGVRIGTRCDGQVQGELMGAQLLAPGYDGSKWVWLRARWLQRRGIVERSFDGRAYEVLWTFDQGGALNAETLELLIGKVPFNGQPADYAECGAEGESDIEFVKVYGRAAGTNGDTRPEVEAHLSILRRSPFARIPMYARWED